MVPIWGFSARAVSALAVAAGLLAAVPARADVTVVLDQAKILRMPKDVAMVVIGNPTVADITLQKSTGIIILTGKTYGATNMIMLDAGGQTLSEQQVVVRAGGDRIVTVQRGAERESLACRPVCERTITVGDGPTAFAAASQQLNDHNSLATGQGANAGIANLSGANAAVAQAALAGAILSGQLPALGGGKAVVPGQPSGQVPGVVPR